MERFANVTETSAAPVPDYLNIPVAGITRCGLVDKRVRPPGGSGRQMTASAETDVDRLRRVVLALESLERSPPEPIILGLAEFAPPFGCDPAAMRDVLERLTDLSLIEGPGALRGSWLFRRITPKGRVFLAEVRSDARWQRIKQTYGHALSQR
ncbi:MAG: hypothetical protein KGM42_12390 [Hyphomicrobiales bacterium]|nr:hypothetical protein [Hyphomicrobiales bacterium]